MIATMVGYGKAALGLLSGSNVITKVVLGFVAFAFAAFLYANWKHEVRKAAIAETIAKIAAEDGAMLERARKARLSWQACRDQGGRWDQSTGRCGQ